MRSIHFLIAGLLFAICMPSAVLSQTCVLACPENMIVRASEGQEGAVVNYPSYQAPQGCGTVSFTPASGSFFRLGSHSVIITSSTGEKCSFTVTVTDNEPPSLTPLTLSRNILWPATGKMKKVGVYYTVSDNGENVKTEIRVSSNAAPADTTDWLVIDDHLLRLKASRLPDGSPRTYTITVTATDDSGNKTTRTTTISVSRSMVAKAN
jgi:hypothetical protein